MSKPMGPREQQLREMREANAKAAESEGIPRFLRRKDNGIKPVTGPLPPAPAPKAEAAKKLLAEAEAIAAENAERKRQKARGRIARMKAKQSGAMAAMPLSGKAAFAAIKAASAAQPQETPMAKKAKAKKTKSKKAKSRGKAPKMRAGGTKLAEVVTLLTRSEGCTAKDCLNATGWPSISMPQQAKSANLALKKEKVDGVFRYYGTPRSKPQQAPAQE